MSGIGDALLAALGADLVLVGEAVPARNRTDWSGLPPGRPAALVRPRTVEDVSATLAACARLGAAVVPQGGLTGLTGGAQPGDGEVALSLERMSGVEEVDTAAATLTALAGTPLEVVQQASAAAGFACGIDLGARGSCTIGGNVATNAGGNTVIRYGMTRASVRGLEVVLADGRIVRSLNKMQKNNAGYDWTQLFIGSEGTLGVVTRVVLALFPAPGERTTVLVAVPDFAAALQLLRRVEAAVPGALLAFEAMWPDYLSFAAAVGRPAPLDWQRGLLVLLEAGTGGGPAAEHLAGTLEAAMGDGLVEDAVIARSERERERLWAIREAPAEYRRYFSGVTGFDVSLPLGVMAEAVAALDRGIKRHFAEAMTLFYGHVADSNLHLVVHVPDAAPQPSHALDEIVYPIVAGLGGTVSAEHGIGRLKRPYLALSRSPDELALMRTMKAALDPHGILNPGKVL